MATILVIEDDPQFVRLLEKVLQPHGHEVAHASTAMAGLRLSDHCRCDLILLDLDLPDLDGKVVATTLRARPALQQVPIIAVSAHDQPTTQRLVLAYGCNGFIPKPIDTRTFPDQIAAFLNRY
jgi:two-component system cell cycle response regulator DivK